jgi:lambda family phage portal protein
MAKSPAILDSFGQAIPRSKPSAGTMRLRFDAAQTNRHNEASFINADTLGPVSYLNPHVRQVIRKRARYEYQNSPFCFGMVTSLADDTIGTGPKLQVELEDMEDSELVESLFGEWADEIDFAGKLHTMRGAKAVDGETFATLGANLGLESPVKLDFKTIEAEMIGSPSALNGFDLYSDGIIYDDFGNPAAYIVLDAHPGDSFLSLGTGFETVRAPEMIHLYDVLRPGQRRGVSEFVAALPLFEQERRYGKAVLSAAETAANHAAIFQTSAQPDGEDEDEPEAYDEIPLERSMGLFLPKGYTVAQMRAEQPTTVYDAYQACLIRQMGRCLQMPFHIASGDASKYNYSSARLSDKHYLKRIRNQRELFRRKALKRLFRRWWEEARLIPGLLSPNLRGLASPPAHSWSWDGTENIDPTKDATGDTIDLANYATTYSEIHAKYGTDWRKSFRQRAREEQMKRDLGLISVAPVPAASPVDPAADPAADPTADPTQQGTPANG